MTHADINDLETRDYIFKIGDRGKGIQARYDENTDALIFPRAAFDYVCKLLNEALSQEPKWISVSERLPEDGQSVLFCDIDNDIMVGYHVKGRPDTHFSQDGTYDDMKNVRAWMPLPEPYKAESEE